MRALASFSVAWLIGCIMPLPARDSGPDVPLDVPPDVRRDAPRDTPGDLPEVTTFSDPEWMVPPGLPADCIVERARHPERLPGLAWEACGLGCTRADLGTTWAASDGFRVDGELWFELLSGDFGAGTRTDALAPAEGAILDAWRDIDSSETLCLMHNYAIGEGRAAVFVSYLLDRDTVALEDFFWLYDLTAGPGVAPPSFELVAPLTGNNRHTQELVVSAELFASRIAFGDVVVRYGGELRQIFSGGLDYGGFDLGAHGDQLIFLDEGAAHRLMQWTPERGLEVLHDPPDPLQRLRHDGTTLAWVRLMDFEGALATRAELWIGEVVRDPALFAPRLVSDRVEPDGVLGGGVYAWEQVADGRTEAHLIDLDTGRHRVLPSPPDHGCETLLVSRDEVTLACATGGGGAPVRRSIYRLAPDIHAVPFP